MNINPIGNWNYWSINKLQALFENNEIKVWTIHLKPGDSLPFYKHQLRYF
ncbi:hypothetical protein LXD69_02955 [Flavobacterium sediminilitoris]|uniref:Uncharacterized protein n=1 Tax=Flavobacterium sediminilitoris TaxID=2024526 RepID=A0ABY4HQK9_9FLAO|nr:MULTISPECIES: hypothetical protein [Flavobacterium]UOX34477.1 hypothetical protein LXD69_02955 [Flavobacterium sediminilitoris]